MRIHFARLAAALLLACALPAAAAAQAWPQRPIKMIVPFPAGGGTDFIARLVAKHLSDRLGQQVFVENRGGANGAVGLQALMQSDPDGYTISACSDTPLVVNPSLYDKLPYAPLRDFVPVATMVRFPGMLAVHPSVPARSVSELIALAKAKPGGLAYASAGVGNFSHLAMELFMQATGVKLLHVPYKGTGPASLALIGGEVQMGFNNVQTLLQNVRAGQLRRARGRRAEARCRRCPICRRSPKRCRDLPWRRGSASSPLQRRRRRSWTGSPRRRSRSCAIRRSSSSSPTSR